MTSSGKPGAEPPAAESVLPQGSPGQEEAPTTSLIAIGYWAGPHVAVQGLPDVADFVDPDWDADERSFISNYVKRGLVSAACMGFSTCRVCGDTRNGNLDLTDGYYVWPEGLVHYVDHHAVRLPARFVEHAYARDDCRSQATRNYDWWIAATPTRRE